MGSSLEAASGPGDGNVAGAQYIFLEPRSQARAARRRKAVARAAENLAKAEQKFCKAQEELAQAKEKGAELEASLVEEEQIMLACAPLSAAQPQAPAGPLSRILEAFEAVCSSD